ncbi:hypothetical protein ScalyP_jg7348 [Parmales sp. scaly parma]|nr:hypothetical protein ScalyP_jg7348 [Parmales sp. scaly parma]
MKNRGHLEEENVQNFVMTEFFNSKPQNSHSSPPSRMWGKWSKANAGMGTEVAQKAKKAVRERIKHREMRMLVPHLQMLKHGSLEWGHRYTIEHPEGSDLWEERQMVSFLEATEGRKFIIHGCSELIGGPRKRPTIIATNMIQRFDSHRVWCPHKNDKHETPLQGVSARKKVIGRGGGVELNLENDWGMDVLIGDDENDRREISCFAAEISGKTGDDGLRREPIVALSTNLEEVKMSEELINRTQRELREPKYLPRDKAKSIAERKEEFKNSPQGIRDSMQYSSTLNRMRGATTRTI